MSPLSSIRNIEVDPDELEVAGHKHIAEGHAKLAAAAAERRRRASLSIVTPDIYSSRRLPPDCPSRDRFHVVAKEIRGAEKIGRTWQVSRAAWEAHRRAARAANPPPRPVFDDLAEADRFIELAGHRSTRRSA